MGFKDISIKRKFTILTTVVGIFMLFISCFGYINTSDTLEESVNNEVVVTLEKAALDMDGWLGQRISIAQAESSLMSSFKGDYAKIKDRNNMSLASHDKDVVDMGIGLEDGTFTSYVLGLTKLDPRTRGWYNNMKSSSEAFNITEPYVDSNTHQTLVSIITPIKSDGSFIGAVCEDIALDILETHVKKILYHGEGTAFFMDHSGNIIATASPDLPNGSNLKDAIDNQAHFNQVMSTPSGTFTCTIKDVEMVFGYATIPSSNWIIGFTVPVDTVFATLQSIRIIFAIITILGLAIVLAFCMRFSSSMTTPILELEDHAKQLSEGNLRLKDIDVNSADEIGSLTQAFNVMSNNLRKLINKMATTAEQVAASLCDTEDNEGLVLCWNFNADEGSTIANNGSAAGYDLDFTKALAAGQNDYVKATDIAGAWTDVNDVEGLAPVCAAE